MDEEIRACTFCKREKPLTEYYKKSKLSDIRMKHCKTCHKILVGGCRSLVFKQNTEDKSEEKMIKCSFCLESKPESDYYRLAKNSEERAKHCKKCHKEAVCYKKHSPQKEQKYTPEIIEEIKKLMSSEQKPSKKEIMQKYNISFFKLNRICDSTA